MTHKTDASYKDEIFRKDHKALFAANRHLASIKPIGVESNEALSCGQMMARDTGDGKYKKFSSVSGGSYDSVCILMDDLSENEVAGAASGSSICRGVFGGELYKDVLTEYVKAELGAKEITDASGDVIVKY
jgi:hypothetical protein